jgi:AcrR family transcriptional regulator
MGPRKVEMSASEEGEPQGAFPIEDPMGALSPTARKILNAARHLLATKGYEAVTLEHVAAEAGVNKASIRYNFGNKAGLVTAVVDSLIHDEFVRGAEALAGLPAEDRVRALVQSKRMLIPATDDFRGLFDILPHAFRDAELRGRVFSSYPWWWEQNLRLLGLEGEGAEDRDDVLAGLGALITAVVDGLAVQAALARDYDLDRPLRALAFLLETAMPELRRRAGLNESPQATHLGG